MFLYYNSPPPTDFHLHVYFKIYHFIQYYCFKSPFLMFNLVFVYLQVPIQCNNIVKNNLHFEIKESI